MINQGNSSSFWGSLVKSYPLVGFINQSLFTIYYKSRIRVLFPMTKFLSKSSKALETRLTFIKIKIPPPTDPNRKHEVR